jgi:hypothetical protein
MKLLGVMLASSLLLPQRGSGEEYREKIDAFFAGPIRTLSLAIDDKGIAQLKKAPREYVEATMTEGDRTFEHVAVKLKGSQGSFQALDRKPGLTLSFDKFAGAKRYHGMKRLHLNNAAQDPTYLNESIAGEIARKAGVPAPRCTHALVKLNGRDLGLYVVREAYTRDFLAEFYTDAGGDLYDGGSADISEKTVKRLGKGDDAADLEALIAACGEKDDAERWKKLDAVVDIERFINYLALENIVVHWDSYSSNRNNYQLYKNPSGGKFSFVLDGMDQTLAFPGHELIQPKYAGTVSDAVLRTPEGRRMYLARVEKVLKTVLKPIDWEARVEAVGRKVRDALAVDHPDDAKAFEKSIKITKDRVAARIRGVEKQIEASPKPARPGKGD